MAFLGKKRTIQPDFCLHSRVSIKLHRFYVSTRVFALGSLCKSEAFYVLVPPLWVNSLGRGPGAYLVSRVPPVHRRSYLGTTSVDLGPAAKNWKITEIFGYSSVRPVGPMWPRPFISLACYRCCPLLVT